MQQYPQAVPMKILVAVKRVVDYNVRIRVRQDGSGVETQGVRMSANPFCEIAIEEAVRLKEQGIADDILAVSVGSDACQEQLRLALALGADRACLLQTEAMPDSRQVARLLYDLVCLEQPGLVLLGKQAIDSDNNQTGQMLAGIWGVAQGTFASELSVDAGQGTVQVTREVDGGLRTVELQLPAVITTDLRLNKPRYASLPNIMKAKSKPLEIRPVTVLAEPGYQRLKVLPPRARQPGRRVDSVDELIGKLHSEAQVI